MVIVWGGKYGLRIFIKAHAGKMAVIQCFEMCVFGFDIFGLNAD